MTRSMAGREIRRFSTQPFGAAYLYGWLARQYIEVGILGKPVREGKGHALSPNYLL
jgi:hypothetical protein